MAVSSSESQANINSLLQQGYTQQQISSYNYGDKLNPNEMSSFITANPLNKAPAAASNIPTLDNLASQQYQFDPNQYLPQIQQTAASIYDPQKAQIEALKAISTQQTEQARITTKKDFANQLQSEIEAINRRGAFFSGGALKAETNIRTAETSALTSVNLQDQASQAGFLAQEAGLSAAQAEYIQEKLTGAENSAYSRFQDYRNFLLNLTQAQRDIYESDRDFQENVRQFGLEYALAKKKSKK